MILKSLTKPRGTTADGLQYYSAAITYQQNSRQMHKQKMFDKLRREWKISDKNKMVNIIIPPPVCWRSDCCNSNGSYKN